METLKFITAMIGFVTAMIGIGFKFKTSKSKNMHSDHVLYYILLVAFVLFIAAFCYLAHLNIRK